MASFMSRRKKILKRMQQLQITEKQLAQYSMLSVKALNLWLDNKITFPFNHILRIAHVLDLDANDIFDVV